MSLPIMRSAGYKLLLFLNTDECKTGFAAILSQVQDGENALIDAVSRRTSTAEANYSSAKLECACVIWAVKKWKYNLEAAPSFTS